MSSLLDQWRAATAPATDAERRILFEQLRLLRESARPIVYVIPPAALIMSVAVAGWTGPLTMAVWLAAVCGVTGLIEFSWRKFDREATPDNAGTWGRIGWVSAGIFACVWGAMSVLFWAPGAYDNHLLLILVVACSMSGASALNAPHLPAAGFSIAAYAVFLIAPTLAEGDVLHWALSGLCLCFCVLMAGQAWHVNQTTRNMLMLREAKDMLVGQLAQAKADSDTARDRAEQASRAKSDFLANMSHELRTPLNAILGFSETIRDRVFGNAGVDRYVEYAGYIHTSGRHLLGLINDILDLAKIESGKLELREEDVEIEPFLHASLRIAAPLAERKKIALAIEVQARAVLCADERALRQILLNLLSNAVKFTPEDGRVSIRAEHGDEGLVISVCDTGIGIAPEDLPRVLESFGQGRHEVAPGGETGTGLGLPIVKGLVEAHGGRFAIASEPGKGTTVRVTFPRERVRKATRAA